MRKLMHKMQHVAVFLWMALPMILCETVVGAAKGTRDAVHFAWRQSRPTWRP